MFKSLLAKFAMKFLNADTVLRVLFGIMIGILGQYGISRQQVEDAVKDAPTVEIPKEILPAKAAPSVAPSTTEAPLPLKPVKNGK